MLPGSVKKAKDTAAVSVFFSEWNAYEVLDLEHFPMAVRQRLNGKEGISLSQSLCGYALCRKALEMLGNEGQFTSIAFEARGKPVLPPDLYCSITHSGSKLGVAIANCEVGLDMEQRKLIDISDLEFVFHPEQREEIRLSENPLMTCYDLWTRKEAYAKMNGNGMGDMHSGLNVPEMAHLYSLELGEAYSCTLCTGKPLEAIPVIITL